MSSYEEDIQISEPQNTVENENCRKIMRGDKRLLAEAFQLLASFQKEPISDSDITRPYKSNMLVALTLFYLSRPKDQNFNKVGEAFFWADKLHSKNQELSHVLRMIGYSDVRDPNKLQQAALAWAKWKEEEIAFWNDAENLSKSETEEVEAWKYCCF